ncbi:amidohydrolase family protein [Humisphaera borealis]|uniref:Amidohydrolase family protein n=1 Tax=Humisphaera borealis TaxID=2807512 RepID=A0A7M2WTB6_9BACT|nr:amidohydrolase family protein [Humisphaera borealis]QOV87850.1 amidohydrolase family protein [Humisphaera borealis]
MTRRELLLAAVASASTSLLPIAAPADAAKAYPPGQFVDMHTHVGQTWNTTKMLSPADLLKWMDEHEISQAIVLPLVSPESSSYPISAQFVLEQTKPHRDRLIPFCCIDPRTTINGGKKGAADMFKSYVDAGCKGFGEHKPGLPIDDPLSMRLYNLCGEFKLPVLFHLDSQRNTDKPGLPGLEAVLKGNPQTTFIGHGPGFWASISGDVKTAADLGGYPKEGVSEGGALDRLMESYPNLCGDLSAGSGAGALKRDLKFAAGFMTRRQDRLMFGTDYLSPGQPVPQFEVLKSIEIPDAVRQKIYRDNARRLLGL